MIFAEMDPPKLSRLKTENAVAVLADLRYRLTGAVRSEAEAWRGSASPMTPVGPILFIQLLAERGMWQGRLS